MSKVDAHADFENDISTASADKTENDLRKASIPDLPIEDDYDIPPPVPPHRTSVTLERPKSANANSCEENAQINTNSGLRYLPMQGRNMKITCRGSIDQVDSFYFNFKSIFPRYVVGQNFFLYSI